MGKSRAGCEVRVETKEQGGSAEVGYVREEGSRRRVEQ